MSGCDDYCMPMPVAPVAPIGDCSSCRCCCCKGMQTQTSPVLDKMALFEYKIFMRCQRENCQLCEQNPNEKCRCECQRNRFIIEVLAYCLNCSPNTIKSLLFKIACQRTGPLGNISRDQEFEVRNGGGLAATLYDFHDLEIYNSMYNRLGCPINPLHPDNTLRVINLMFLAPILTKDQYQYLLLLLGRLNARVKFQINIFQLMEVVKNLDIQQFACSILLTDRKAHSLYNAKCFAKQCHFELNVPSIGRKKSQKKKRKSRESKKSGKSVDLSMFCTRQNPRLGPQETAQQLSVQEMRGSSMMINRSISRPRRCRPCCHQQQHPQQQQPTARQRSTQQNSARSSAPTSMHQLNDNRQTRESLNRHSASITND